MVGVVNLVDGLRLPLAASHEIEALNGLGDSLSALGGTAQGILGLMLVLAGVGSCWRLVSAWVLAFLLLLVAVGVNVVLKRWGLTLAFQGVLLGALLWSKRYYTRRTVAARLILSLSGILAILAYGVFGSFLLGKGFHPEIHDLNTATYFTITTLATVAFGDIVPVTNEARWFVVSLVVIGIGVFVGAIVSGIGPIISAQLKQIFNPKEQIMEPKDHVILVGEGPIARNTAAELKRRGVAFVQIVVAKSGPDAPGQLTIAGDATTDAVLKQAGIQHARMVIAAREDDGENAFIALGAKDLNPKVRVLAVASSALSIRRLKLARADLVFSPVAVGSRLLADLVEGKQIFPEFHDLLEGHPEKT
jgi:voltage-gated potassium channel